MRTCHAVVRVAHIASLVLMLAIRASAAGQVIVVDPVAGPGVDFTSVSDAVLAAADGDTVLVHAGTYAASVTVSSKSLAIVAQPGDIVTISGALEASDLASNQLVSIAGLTLDHGLRFENDAGAVWVENCIISGFDDVAFPWPIPDLEADGGIGVEAIDCDSVTLARCTLDGGSATAFGGSAYAGDALVSAQSRVWLFDVDAKGGHAQGCAGQCGEVPGSGAEISGGTLYLAGSTIHGYHGVQVYGQPVLWLLDSTVEATGYTWLGDQFPPIEGTASVTQLAGSERDFALDTPATEHETVTLSLNGVEGDGAWVLLGLQPTAVMSVKLHGPLMVLPPWMPVFIGVLPPGGTLALPVTLPTLDPGLETLALVLQAAFVDSSGATWLSDPSRLVILDAAF